MSTVINWGNDDDESDDLLPPTPKTRAMTSPLTLQQAHARLKETAWCLVLRLRDFNEAKQEWHCRVCHYLDPLGTKLHDDECPVYALHAAIDEAEAALLAVPQELPHEEVAYRLEPAPAPRSAEALERRIARIASRACTGQQGESQIEYEIEELLKDALAAAPAQGQTLDVNALREAFDAGFWAWPNANEPERIALREAWIMRCVAAQGQTERLR